MMQMKPSLDLQTLVSERVAALAVTLSTIVFWLTIFTFPNFFFFSPFENPDPLYKVEQSISTLGWICLGVLPLVFAWLPKIRGRSTEPLYVFGSILWPISVFVIQLTLLIQGSGFYSYLANYPILIFTDIISCIFLLLLRKQIFSRN
jgi:hypothetical protein